MLVKTIFILLLITLIFWYPSIDFSFSLLIIPLINISWSIHSVLDPFWFLSSFWKLRFWSLSTLFLRACINSSSSFSMINSFPWLGFMCISLLSLSSLSLPRFAFLNDSAFSKLLMGLTAFLLKAWLIHHPCPLLPSNLISSKVVFVADHSSQLVGFFD